MDNLTHALVGLALSRAGLRSLSPSATALLVLSANAPDLDIIALSSGPLRYFEMHRGYSHSLLCLPLMAALTVFVVAAVRRRPLPWLRAWLLCCIGVASHLLLDWTNTYGIRLLLPFSSRWFHLDINGLYDFVLLGVLIFAAVWPWFTRLVSREIGAKEAGGRGIARFALLFFFLFDCARAVLHARATAQLESRLYDDMPPVRVGALPNAFNPLRWTGIVESTRAHYVFTNGLLGDDDNTDPQEFLKIPQTPEIQVARRDPSFQFFIYFAQYPVWTEEPVELKNGRGKRIELVDLRFGRPGLGSFHSIALANAKGKLLRSWFTYSNGTELGRDAASP